MFKCTEWVTSRAKNNIPINFSQLIVASSLQVAFVLGASSQAASAASSGFGNISSFSIFCTIIWTCFLVA